MDLRRRIALAATSYADDLSFRSLAEVSEITADQNVRIIGGQMASLLLAAFPVPGIGARRTRDTDAAITTELAGSGVVHQRLLDRGYAATSGNSYARAVPELAAAGAPVPELAVDLLVPSLDGRFRPEEYGGRAFDAAPGLAPVLAADPIVIDVSARLLDGAVLEFTVRVPTVELALVVKALSYGSRLQARDVEDIYRLLEIADTHAADEIGGWQLRAPSLRGSRRDAAVQLNELARRTRRMSGSEVPAGRLAALVVSLVGRPA
ncbi:hypothetical protein Val02_57740 [Virgisporangium aliadipatigenens]|uniref:Uncharacterized protein n=1 Tax=Virgisporangium aliadipatigenens TaxID=741659 RepID=A0A8J3YR83_9ACTN|nr:hypothetical protein [Virgisporangium aliadipatigenens]GIJ48888.1 hypothetical protein Val02_57740 [Virgisporangium aliadipatigenens]